MNTSASDEAKAGDRNSVWVAWRDDLEHSREFGVRQQRGMVWLLDWYMQYLERAGLPPGRESAREF